MEYFNCEVRIDDDNETPVEKVYLLHLPRIGEHMCISISSGSFRCIVKDIWHFCGDDKVGHRMIIYVNMVV